MTGVHLRSDFGSEVFLLLLDAVRFEKGEGIEKKQEDFAAEVAAQMNAGH